MLLLVMLPVQMLPNVLVLFLMVAMQKRKFVLGASLTVEIVRLELIIEIVLYVFLLHKRLLRTQIQTIIITALLLVQLDLAQVVSSVP